MRQIILIVHNVRSAHNVGSLLRTAEGLGIEKVYLTGYTPYPAHKSDQRLPHLAKKIHQRIAKTGLGAEVSVKSEHVEDIDTALNEMRNSGFAVFALEQAKNSILLPEFRPGSKIALIVGREVEGIEPEILKKVEKILEIPMFGKKESYNVAQAAAMALYHLKFS